MMELIPAIDLIGGKPVRLTEGDFSRKVTYGDDPLEVAKRFEGAGLQRLHLVDLDGARNGSVVNWQTLETITSGTSLQVDFGGGVKTEEAVQRILDAGASWVTVGSLAVTDPERFSGWLGKYGPEKFFLGADVRNEMLAIHGWQQTTAVSIMDLIERYKSLGLRYVFCTDISKDGMLAGAATELYQKIMAVHPDVQLVASGGVTTIDDLYALQEAGCFGAIIGKAIYENRISLAELQTFMHAH